MTSQHARGCAGVPSAKTIFKGPLGPWTVVENENAIVALVVVCLGGARLAAL